MTPEDNALDAQAVAEMLQVSRNTVYNLVKQGLLGSYMVGRKMRFTREDVAAYIASSRPKAAASRTVPAPALAPEPQRRPASAAQPERRAFRIAGNEMCADVLANYVGSSGAAVQRVYTNSYQSLASLYAGEADAAVIHLYDHRTKTFNVPYVQRLVPGQPVVVIRLVARKQGFLVAAGNPKKLRSWRDLLRDDVSMVNRERGAGARILVDECLIALDASLNRPQGYGREMTSQLALASFVASGGSDVAVGGEREFHQVSSLNFIPLVDEYVDLVVLKDSSLEPVVRFLRRVCASRGFRDELGHVVGYQVKDTGNVVYEV